MDVTSDFTMDSTSPQTDEELDEIFASSEQVVALALPSTLFDDFLVNISAVTNTTNGGIVFTFYETPVLFPLANGSDENDIIGSSIVGANIVGLEDNVIVDLADPVVILLRLNNQVGPLHISNMHALP